MEEKAIACIAQCHVLQYIRFKSKRREGRSVRKTLERTAAIVLVALLLLSLCFGVGHRACCSHFSRGDDCLTCVLIVALQSVLGLTAPALAFSLILPAVLALRRRGKPPCAERARTPVLLKVKLSD